MADGRDRKMVAAVVAAALVTLKGPRARAEALLAALERLSAEDGGATLRQLEQVLQKAMRGRRSAPSRLDTGGRPGAGFTES
ncbi:hypothetical protein [Archangium violaceum]|uniref:hypothetical protein n=1 Tax=Archangium violaceum TaxID=83451 RepID=UPI0036D80776